MTVPGVDAANGGGLAPVTPSVQLDLEMAWLGSGKHLGNSWL